MNRMLSLILVILLLGGAVGAHAQATVPDCDAGGTAYVEAHLYPVFEDYMALRETFVEDGNFGQAGGELIELRAGLDAVLEDSPACLDGLVLDLALSMANLQTGILFLILSFEMEDPALAERFQQMGLYYTSQSDAQFASAGEAMDNFAAKSLVIEGDLDAGHA